MFRSFVIIIFLVFLVPGIGHAQEQVKTNSQLSQVGVSFKVLTGPEIFFQSNLKAPMPVVGLRGSFVLNTTEIELGINYFPKMYEIENNDPSLDYKTVFFTYHYVLPSIHIHQKLFCKNKHLLSASLGVDFVHTKWNYADTIRNDGSHYVVHGPTAERGIRFAFQLGFGFRYTYLFAKNVGFFMYPYLNIKTNPELVQVDPTLNGAYQPTYIPPVNFVSLGLSFGFHFMVNFDKEAPPRFFLDTE